MILLIILIGLAVGSFLNVVIDRLPRGESIVWKPSHCDYCKKRLRWYELFPVVSFIVQKGMCIRCRKQLSFQYPILEIVTSLGIVLLYSQFHEVLIHFFTYTVIFSAFLCIFVIDFKHQIIPDSLLLALCLAIGVSIITLPPADWISHIGVALSTGLLFYVLWFVTRGRGLGFDDVKLSTVLGLFLGYPHTIIALYIAFLTGAFYGVILMIAHQAQMKSRIAFGPFLIIGATVACLWGDILWRWWLYLL